MIDPQLSLSRALTDAEKAALQHYGADSTFLHAAVQRRGADFTYHPEWDEFTHKCASIRRDLDSAILASALQSAATVYSGHGHGFAVRGWLEADPSAFIGMTYRYPGYISTSTSLEFCYSFLGKRRDSGSRPVLLAFKLPTGFNAIDMKHSGHSGEFELLLGRDYPFRIIAAKIEDGDILYLTLQPATNDTVTQ